MRVASAMVMLLYCVIVASAVAVNNDAALADDDAAPEDDVESLTKTLEAALNRSAPERDPETLDGQMWAKILALEAESTADKQTLSRVNEQVTQSGAKILALEAESTADKQTLTCSDNGGLLQLLFSQINERVTQNGANIRVLEAQTTADKQTLSEMNERFTQSGAKIRVLEAQTTADKQTLNEMKEQVTQSGAKIRVLEAESTADKQRLQTLTRQLEDDKQRLLSEMKEQATQSGAKFRVLEAESSADKQRLQTLTRQLEDAGASTFVRWGSSTCGAGNASSLVYSGVVGGGYFEHSGAAVNYLCLTLSPRLSQKVPFSGNFALLYGAEYQTYDSHQNKNPVCAVCRAASSTTVMIPGTDTCTPGWRLQYSGFLMAGRYIHVAASEYICVDRALESAAYPARDKNGALLYYTKTVCGALPCAPYVNDKVVTCAVCSK